MIVKCPHFLGYFYSQWWCLLGNWNHLSSIWSALNVDSEHIRKSLFLPTPKILVYSASDSSLSIDKFLLVFGKSPVKREINLNKIFLKWPKRKWSQVNFFWEKLESPALLGVRTASEPFSSYLRLSRIQAGLHHKVTTSIGIKLRGEIITTQWRMREEGSAHWVFMIWPCTGSFWH